VINKQDLPWCKRIMAIINKPLLAASAVCQTLSMYRTVFDSFLKKLNILVDYLIFATATLFLSPAICIWLRANLQFFGNYLKALCRD
jgi:hypothetical protein